MILEVNRQPVKTVQDVAQSIAKMKDGEVALLRVRRGQDPSTSRCRSAADSSGALRQSREDEEGRPSAGRPSSRIGATRPTARATRSRCRSARRRPGSRRSAPRRPHRAALTAARQLPGPLRPEDHLELDGARAERTLELHVHHAGRELAADQDEIRRAGSPPRPACAGAPWVRARPPPSTNGVTRSTKPSPCELGADERGRIGDADGERLAGQSAAGGGHVRLAGRARVDVRAVTDVAVEEGLERIDALRAGGQRVEAVACQGGGARRGAGARPTEHAFDDSSRCGRLARAGSRV